MHQQKPRSSPDYFYYFFFFTFNYLLPDHPLLDSAPNFGPLISPWEINKFENCWYKKVRILKVLKILFQQFFIMSCSQKDMSGPMLGDLSNKMWSGGYYVLLNFYQMKWKSVTFWECRRCQCGNINANRKLKADKITEALYSAQEKAYSVVWTHDASVTVSLNANKSIYPQKAHFHLYFQFSSYRHFMVKAYFCAGLINTT